MRNKKAKNIRKYANKMFVGSFQRNYTEGMRKRGFAIINPFKNFYRSIKREMS